MKYKPICVAPFSGDWHETGSLWLSEWNMTGGIVHSASVLRELREVFTAGFCGLVGRIDTNLFNKVSLRVG